MTTTYEHQIHRAIAAGRALAKQTQAELAEALTAALGRRYTRTMVTKLEQGIRPVRAEELRAIAEIQGLPIEFYLYGPAATVPTGDKNRANPGSLNPAAAAVSVAA